MQYSTSQRIAFAGLVIGFILCTSGAIAPFWQQGSLSIDTITKIFGEVIPFIGDLKIVKMYGGLWWYCIEDVLGDKQCEFYKFDDKTTLSWIICIVSSVNVLLTLLCALVALCRTCCCTGGKTICHGIMAFLAGGAGIAAVGMFAGTSHDGFGLQILMVEYGWAMYIYAAGSCIITLVSFMLCFASPNNPLTPVIISSVNHMLPNGRYTRMSDDRVLLECGGQMYANDSQVHYPHVQNY